MLQESTEWMTNCCSCHRVEEMVDEGVSYFLNKQSGLSSGISRETRVKFGVRRRTV